MRRLGHAIFADRLARFATDVDDRRIGAAAQMAARPVTVSVRGRPGVGRETVGRALSSAGLALGDDGDVDVYVIAEVVKPEDRAAIAASNRPTLVVLNKADLIADPQGSCARYQALTGTPTVPMVAHLAVARVDEPVLSALRVLAIGSPALDRLPAAERAFLLVTLDRLGIAEAVKALRAGTDVRRALRNCSGVDGVLAALRPLVAEAGYQRLRTAVVALEMLAATVDAGQARLIETFLFADDTVHLRMATAVDVVESSGMTLDHGNDAAAYLARAAQWQRFRGGPINAVHASCANDIVRGSLRLWRRATA